jgi:myo-inositol-1(or 4)-monophosphatase
MHELALIQEILDEVSVIALEKHANRATLKVSSKLNAVDLLTEADEYLQALITERILARFPDDAIVGEELGSDVLPDDILSRRAWVIDPIDGTQNFVRGLYAFFGISIGFVDCGEIKAGGVHLPTIHQQFLAAKGLGATCNGVPIHVSDKPTLNVARIEIDYGNPVHRDDIMYAFEAVVREAGEVRSHCAAVVGICSVACGEMDAYYHTHLKPWDFAGAQIILEEAGGTVSQITGDPVSVYDVGTSFLGTNGHLHAESLDRIRLKD